MSLTNVNKLVTDYQIKKDWCYMKKLEDKIKYLEIGIQELSRILNSSTLGNDKRISQSIAIVEILQQQIKV